MISLHLAARASCGLLDQCLLLLCREQHAEVLRCRIVRAGFSDDNMQSDEITSGKTLKMAMKEDDQRFSYVEAKFGKSTYNEPVLLRGYEKGD